MIYADTDSIKEHMNFINRNSTYGLSTEERRYIEKDNLATKIMLNSIYGRQVMMNKDYICVCVDKSPVVIFKDKIVAIEKRGDKASILCAHDVEFYTDNKYVDVIKMLL